MTSVLECTNKDPMMEIIAVGVSFKTTPIAVREEIYKKVTFEKLARLKDNNPNVLEMVLLSTCNRLEIYATCKNAHDAARILFPLLSSGRSGGKENVFQYIDLEAVRHVFRVAAGMDSLVVGESQVLRQILDAPKKSAGALSSDGVLNRLFSKAHSLGSEIRQSHAHGLDRSLGLSVAHFVERYFARQKSDEGLPSKPNILLVGSGKMIRVAASSFDRSKIGSLVVMARTTTQARSINGDDFVDISELSRVARGGSIDAILVATSADSYLISRKDLAPVGAESVDAAASAGAPYSKPLLIIDISFPRNVDPDVRGLENVTLYDLDDLGCDREFNAEAESYPGAAESGSFAEALITFKAHEFISWMNQK
ncbi:MAG: hypothetical protein M1368_03645, partial [Thaumarchaeota archaeon]|nr:hypothetical protein [Nitrososphaerota archaeon]